jgi:osmoprotectant transport system permease protein
VSNNLREQFLFLPEYLRGHLILTVAAMLMGVAISVPLGVLATRVPKLKRPVLAVVSVIQTIPSLAILALILALLGGRIGFLPAFLALTLYSMLPIVRNTVTGLENVSDDVIEAARGIGMTKSQILMKVRLPLALPVLIAGIRTATVWTVGLATLSTLVGATSLGNYIFSGIQTRNLTAVTVGSIVAAILALILDAAIGGLQWLAEQRANTESLTVKWAKRSLIPGTAVLLIAGGAFLMDKKEYDYVVGGKGFTEQYIMAELFTSYLEDAGYRIDTRTGFGSDVVYEATRNNDVAVYLEYSGTAWANHMRREDNPGREAVREAVIEWMHAEHGLVTLGPTGFENLYALAMRRDRAEELGIGTIEDMLPYARDLVCAGDLEFFSRPEWIRLRDT